MRNTRSRLAIAAGTIGIATTLSLAPALAQDNAAESAYKDIERTLGSVPTYMKNLPEVAIAGAWAEYKGLVLSPSTKLDGKTKQLIAIAVAAQVPCSYCSYGHTAFAKLSGATDEEIREAVAMGAVVRHWSTVANGTQVDLETHKKEIDAVIRHVAAAKKAAVKAP